MEENKPVNQTNEPIYDFKQRRNRVGILLIEIISLIASIAMFITCLVAANVSPLTSKGREAPRAIMFFVAFMFLGFAITAFLCLVLRRKNKTLATKSDKKYNIVTLASEANNNSNQQVEEAVNKSKHSVSSLSELHDYFIQYMNAYGFKSDSLSPLLASIIYSRLSILKVNDEDFVDIFANFFGHNATVIDYVVREDLNIVSYIAFLNMCSKAASDPDVPFFVVINNAKLKTMKDFFLPIYKGIKSPTEKCRFISKGEEILLPRNINFIFKIDENEQVFDTDKDLLDYASYFEIAIEKGEEGESHLPVNLSYLTLGSLLKEAKQNYLISDDAWRRVDAIIDAACLNTDFTIDNKSYLKIENFCFSLYVFTQDDYKAIDETLANVVLISILSHWDSETIKANSSIERTLSNNLGGKAPKTMARMKRFLKLFDKEGNRL